MYPSIPSQRPFEVIVPDRFRDLSELAFNLWWSWTPDGRQLFERMKPESWKQYHNPVEVLLEMHPPRWKRLQDGEFQTLYTRVMDEFHRYMEEAGTRDDITGPMVYFSPEYGLHDALSIFSGGLGVLSGEHLKSASDRDLPLVGVGLLYRNGYFRQEIDADGDQHHLFPAMNFQRLPIEQVLDEGGEHLYVECPLKDETVHLKVWKVQVGRIPLLLLDSDNRRNPHKFRSITSQLYVRDPKMRLCQEIMLGMGGARALQALDIRPRLWHLNEGHSGLMMVERLRALLTEGIEVEEARSRIRQNTLFTSHTPVMAGHEAYPVEVMEEYLRPTLDEMGIPMSRFLAFGRTSETKQNVFNLTALSFRFSGGANAVSDLHARVTREMWGDLIDTEPITLRAVTNGINMPTWMGREWRDRLDLPNRCWEQDVCDQLLETIDDLSDRELWDLHRTLKENLIEEARDRIRTQRTRQGEEPDELEEVASLIDPDALLVGYARRFAEYKRPLLILRDFERIRAMMIDRDQPLQIMFAGKAHPDDQQGQEFIRRIYDHMKNTPLERRLFFLEDYDMNLASLMVQGTDVWLNTPRRPMEACGTSGMKAALNGVLHLSTVDGWWAEAHTGHNGWALGSGEEFDDPNHQDELDARHLYETLEEEVLPAFYDRDENGFPRRWIGMMREAIHTVIPRYSTFRMVEEYEQKAYGPLLADSK